jgi:hypothetical protein
MKRRILVVGDLMLDVQEVRHIHAHLARGPTLPGVEPG